MAKITLNDQTTGYLSSSAINTNNSLIEDHLNNKVLYRDNPTGEPNQLNTNLDMNFNTLLNVSTDINEDGSLMTVADGNALYLPLAGGALTGPVTIQAPTLATHPVTKGIHDVDKAAETAARVNSDDIETAARIAADDAETAARISADDAITSAYTSADASLQDQMTGTTPLAASAFSEVSWHDQEVANSVSVPANKNAWSFGPTMTIALGQTVTLGSNSNWMIANGQEPETASNHVPYTNSGTNRNVEVDLINLIDPSTRRIIMADTDVDLADIAINTTNISTNTSNISTNTTNIATNTSDIAANTVDIAANSSALTTKAGLASPAFTGTPTAPTAVTGTNTTQIASTAFVQQEVTGATGSNLATATNIWTGSQSIVDFATDITGGDPGNGLYLIEVDSVSATQLYRLTGQSCVVGAGHNAVSTTTSEIDITAAGDLSCQTLHNDTGATSQLPITNIWKIG